MYGFQKSGMCEHVWTFVNDPTHISNTCPYHPMLNLGCSSLISWSPYVWHPPIRGHFLHEMTSLTTVFISTRISEVKLAFLMLTVGTPYSWVPYGDHGTARPANQTDYPGIAAVVMGKQCLSDAWKCRNMLIYFYLMQLYINGLRHSVDNLT